MNYANKDLAAVLSLYYKILNKSETKVGIKTYCYKKKRFLSPLL